MKPSFAVIALLVCFLGVLVTTISSHGPFELASDNQEDESKLRVSEEAVEGDRIDQEDEEEESEDVDDANEVDNSERYFFIILQATPCTIDPIVELSEITVFSRNCLHLIGWLVIKDKMDITNYQYKNFKMFLWFQCRRYTRS